MSKLTNLIQNKLKDTFIPLNKFETKDGSLIKKVLLSDEPCMIARFGSTEIKAVLFPKISSIIKPFVKERIFMNMKVLSGFYPVNDKSIQKFSDLMYQDMKEVDILGSWRIEEIFLKNHISRAKKILLENLEPYYFEQPWSEVLKNKKVLVIHPFTETIENQYRTKRELLFKNELVLPEFESLQTIKAVQSIAGNTNEFKNWFEALDHMKNEIDKKDFDIAIIGCGAYGFPLAAHVKRIGKKAVHLGGATQILFGIKGKRWEENENFKDIINEYFVRPMEKDKPENFEKVEDGCYW